MVISVYVLYYYFLDEFVYLGCFYDNFLRDFEVYIFIYLVIIGVCVDMCKW